MKHFEKRMMGCMLSEASPTKNLGLEKVCKQKKADHF